MTFAPGSALGPYEIVAPLGAGGMGEVLRARDTKLGREVAIKVLPAAFAQDAERLARFRREAQILASLNHPNIAAIYGLEESEGVLALVMELVEGEDLSERLKRGAVPIEDAVLIAKQIADALEEAHEKGIVHRDLKPANVKVTADGKVKVLDFGLAKAFAGDPASSASVDLSQSPTLATVAGTRMGVILGTAAYMSPEQARGKTVDRRADIWSFGVVLFEMLSGQRLFAGETVSDTLAAVLTREPDWDALPRGASPALQRLLRRCLERNPLRRMRDIGEARIAIEDLVAGQEGAPAPQAQARSSARVAWGVAGAAVLAAVALVATRSGTHEPKAPVRHFAIDLPWSQVPNWTDFDVALSPDGTRIAWYGRKDDGNDVSLYVRALDSLEAVALDDAREADGVAFSPDGEWIALADPRGLRKVSVRGGRPQPLTSIRAAWGLSWGADGGILVGHASGLQRVPASGGPVEPFTKLDAAAGETGHIQPFHMPDGTHALMTVLRGEQSQLALVDLATRTHRLLPMNGRSPAWVSSGHIVFRQGASVLAARFDPDAPDAVDQPVPVLEDVRHGPYVATDGTMLYIPERGDSSARLVWVDHQGRPTPIEGERLDYSHLSLDTGGSQALLNISPDVYVRDIARGTRRRVASGGVLFPIWSRDGRWATYTAPSAEGRAIVRQPADGSAGAESLITTDTSPVPTSWNARTGELALFDRASDIWVLRPGGTARRFLAEPYNERSGRFSPDGRWLSYVSDETGTYQVYVVPYPGPGPKVAVSIDGGLEPIWSADGRELFFRKGGRVLAAAMKFAPTLTAEHPVELFHGPYTLDLMGHQRWDVAPDGRFLMVENSDAFRSVLVQSWSEELTRLVPGGGAR